MAQIADIAASRGDRVEAGEVLAELERRDAEIALAEADAALASAENHLADLREGKAYTTPDDITQWKFASDDWYCPSAEPDLKAGGACKARVKA